MALSSKEKQKRYREMRKQSGDRHLTCWISREDDERLFRLMESLGCVEKGKLQRGYSEIISLALENLESNLDKPVVKSRYGLVMLNDSPG